jgi:hypothetical protein
MEALRRWEDGSMNDYRGDDRMGKYGGLEKMGGWRTRENGGMVEYTNTGV